MGGMYSPQTVEILGPQTDCPDIHLPFARAFIAQCPFTFARSVPKNPHEYCLRTWLKAEVQPDYDRFMALVDQHGYPGRFLKTHYTYLNVDGWRYWETPELFADGRIINRARNVRTDCCKLAEATGGKHHATTCVSNP